MEIVRLAADREEGISIGASASLERPVVLKQASVAQSVTVEAGSSVESRSSILPRDRGGLMAFGGVRVTPDGQSHAYTWSRALSSLYIADGLT